MLRFILAALVIALAVAPAAAQDKIRYSEDAMRARQLSTPQLSLPDAGMGLWVQVTISPTGEVIDAISNPLNPPSEKVDSKPALAAARTLRFRPFLHRGRPVTAVGAIWISYGGRTVTPRWANPNADFPAIDYSSLQIELIRADGCDGYRVKIDGAGNVAFSMLRDLANARPFYSAFVSGQRVAGGSHHRTIGRKQLDALIERFRAARFFGLEKDYVQASDSCPTEMRLRTSDRDMTVRWDRHGEMPGEVHGIAEAIEAAADSTLWIQGNERTIASFLAEGANLNGSDGAYLVAAAMRLANEQVVLDAIEAGVPLEVRFPPGVTKAPALGIWLVREAAQQGASRVFALLTRRDWLRRMPHSDLGAILAGTAGACEPSIIRALVDAGADVNYRLSPASALNSGTPSGATVLMRVLVPNHECHGKDVELALEALIDLGADVNMRDDEGTPVILLWPDDALTLHLLEAGADPAVTDAKGRTLRQTATDEDMPGTLAWLDAHGLP